MQGSDSSHPIDRWIAQNPKSRSNPTGRSRSALAEKVGCQPSRISQICNDGEFPGRDLALLLQKETGISAGTLMGLDRHPAPKAEDAA